MKTFKTEVKANSGSLSGILCFCCNRAAKKTEAAQKTKALFGKFASGIKKRIKSKRKTLAGDLEDEDDDDDDFQIHHEGENDDALSDGYVEDTSSGMFKGGKEKQASINFYSYEFERIIKGDKGEQLIKYLSNQPLSSPLFESPTVHAYLDSQWQVFQWQYYMIVLLYLSGFAIMFPYVEMQNNAKGDDTKSFGQLMF